MRQDYLATAGFQSTLTALQEGKVDQLFLARNESREGVQCTKCSFYLVRREGECPYCGGELREGVDRASIQIPPGAPYRIAVVCLGNICRSPIAEVVLTSKLEQAGLGDEVEVVSAGTGGWHVGEPMDRRAAGPAADKQACQKPTRLWGGGALPGGERHPVDDERAVDDDAVGGRLGHGVHLSNGSPDQPARIADQAVKVTELTTSRVTSHIRCASSKVPTRNSRLRSASSRCDSMCRARSDRTSS